MFNNIVSVAKDIRADLIEVYWILLVPLVCLLIVVELIKDSDSPPQGGRILKRVVISILLLMTFNFVANTIGLIGDGIIEKIDQIENMQEVLKNIGPKKENLSNEWFNLREHILYAFSLIAYIIAYLGFFVAEALTQFVWIILYTISPLMILAYVPAQTANITANLYKGLVKVVVWKILWCVLGALLLKMASEPMITGMADWILAIVMNLCIGLSMLFIPVATKSLINDGLEGAASALGAVPTFAATKFMKTGVAALSSKTKSSARNLLHPQKNRSQKMAGQSQNFKNRPNFNNSKPNNKP